MSDTHRGGVDFTVFNLHAMYEAFSACHEVRV